MSRRSGSLIKKSEAQAVLYALGDTEHGVRPSTDQYHLINTLLESGLRDVALDRAALTQPGLVAAVRIGKTITGKRQLLAVINP